MLWSDCPSSFLHTQNIKRNWKKLYTTQPESNLLKLKDLCRTRWIERIDALDCIKKLYSSIVACFENISAEGSRMWSPDSVIFASNLLLVITRTEFIIALVITNECLKYLRSFTMSLQEDAKDTVQAVSEVTTLTPSLKLVRENVDSYHSRWFETISKMCNKEGLYHHYSGYVVVSATEQAYQHVIPLNSIEELSQFNFGPSSFWACKRFSSHQKLFFKV